MLTFHPQDGQARMMIWDRGLPLFPLISSLYFPFIATSTTCAVIIMRLPLSHLPYHWTANSMGKRDFICFALPVAPNQDMQCEA